MTRCLSTRWSQTPFTDQVKARISVLERERDKGREYMEEAKKHLVRMGFGEDRIKAKYVEKNKSIAKDIIDEVLKGGYGTVVLGRRGMSNLAGMLFGSVSSGGDRQFAGSHHLRG